MSEPRQRFGAAWDAEAPSYGPAVPEGGVMMALTMGRTAGRLLQ